MQVLAVLHHILPAHDGGDGGGVGGRAADAPLLQSPDESGLGVPGGGLGELLLGLHPGVFQLLPLLQVGQRGLDLAGLLVLALLVHRQKARELHLGPAGLEHIPGAGDLQVHAVVNGGGHLAGQEAAPDQLIQPELLRGQVLFDALGGQLHVGGADGLVGVLCPGLGLEPPGGVRQVLLPIPGGGKLPGGGNGLVGQAQGVGTHVGDKTHGALSLDIHALIQLLGDGHGPPGAHVQLPAGLLLEGAGDKGGRGRAGLVLALDGADLEGGGLDGGQNLVHLLLGFQLLLLLPAVELGLEAAGVGGDPVQQHLQSPVFLGDEGADLLFPLGHQAGGHGLDPAGGQAPADLLPQQGGELIAHNPVQNAPGLLGVHQVLVNVPGGGDALGNHLFGDLVEGNPAGLVLRQVQQLLQVPGDGLPFPVRVGGQVHLGAFVRRVLQQGDGLLLSLNGLVVRLEAVLDVYPHLALGQVPDMPHGGQHLIVRPQIFSDGLCLSR